MKVKDCMTREVRTLAPDRPIQEAARLMAECDVGAIPIGDNDRLVGMITDRDIAIRAVCAGKDADTPIEEVMTRDIKYCFEDEDLQHVAQNMGDIQVRRLPVLNREKRLVGIVALGDIANGGRGKKLAGDALGAISRQGGQHNQSAGAMH
ncbi:MAG: CBS domain-containing protein [Panacagrimonas sp.]